MFNEQELVVMRSRFRLIAFTFVMKCGFEKSMKRNVENPDFGSDSIFFAFPIKESIFGVDSTHALLQPAKIDASSLSDCSHQGELYIGCCLYILDINQAKRRLIRLALAA